MQAEELKEIAEALRDASSGIKLNKHAFKGSDLVKWLIKSGYATDKEEAENIANLLMSLGYVHSSTRSKEFSNSSSLFSFNASSPSTSQRIQVSPSGPRLVIIGGGGAGSTLAQTLASSFQVTLIDAKNYFEVTPAFVSVVTDASLLSNYTIKHEDYLKDTATFIHAKVAEVATDQVTLHDGRQVPFDYLIIASGSSYTAPIKVSVETNRQDVAGLFPHLSNDGNALTLEDRQKEALELYQEVKSAKKILIVGGGPVGVEIAGEILVKFPKKSVTLVTNSATLLNRLSAKTQQLAESKLKSKGATIIYNESVNTSTEDQKTFTTSKGTVIEADLVLRMIGITPNSAFMRTNFSDKLDERGFIKVNEYLQLEGQRNIFVVGDVTAVPEEKSMINVYAHVANLRENIKNLVEDKPLKAYATGPLAMLVSVGPKDGVLYNNGSAMGWPGSAFGWLKRTAFKAGIHAKSGCSHDSEKKCFACKMLRKD